MKAITRKTALAAVGATLLGGAAAAQDTIKIGVTQPLTGAFAASGNYVAQGAKIAEEEINKAGGVLGKKIQLIVEDNKSNPTEAVATAEKLIVQRQGAGDDGRLELDADAGRHAQARGIQGADAGRDLLVRQDHHLGQPLHLPHQPDLGDGGQGLHAAVQEDGRSRRSPSSSTNNDFGLGAAKEFAEAAKTEGVQVGVMETMDPKATDFSAQLAKIKASGGDTLFVTTAVEQITLILKQAKDQQLTARIITTGGSNSPDQLIAQAGEAANGSYHLVFFTPWFPEAVKNPDIAKKFVALWNEKKHQRRRPDRGLPRLGRPARHRRGHQGRRQSRARGHHQGDVGRQGQGHQRRHRLHQAGPEKEGVKVVARETMDPKATDFSAQLAKIKASGADTVFVTTAVEQATLILKQAKDQQVTARIITTGGSVSPDQLIAQAGEAANGSYHLVFFTPWFPEAVKNPDVAKRFVALWNEKKYNVGGLTEGFRGWDGLHVIVAAIKAAGKAEPEAITKALWGVKVKGINGDIAFIKQGPAGKESAQNVPSVYLVKIDGGKVTRQ